jgi:uncharacterized protein (TIGR01777 family)
MESILITGGSGLIGKHLTRLLQKEGYRVLHLSRSAKGNTVETFVWDVKRRKIDTEAVRDADHIIHLAGANVAEKRWTPAFREEIISSRVESAGLLFDSIKKIPNSVKTFISASGIGYYGDRNDEWLEETAAPGNDFLAQVCVKWEAAAQQFSSINRRSVSIRTGIVLSGEGGALPPLAGPVRFGIAPKFGTGNQFYSWIHIDDLCGIYLQAIRNEAMTGSYNGVAPSPERFVHFMEGIAKVLQKRKLNIPVPMGHIETREG